jgi:hypothetical protein
MPRLLQEALRLERNRQEIEARRKDKDVEVVPGISSNRAGPDPSKGPALLTFAKQLRDSRIPKKSALLASNCFDNLRC